MSRILPRIRGLAALAVGALALVACEDEVASRPTDAMPDMASDAITDASDAIPDTSDAITDASDAIPDASDTIPDIITDTIPQPEPAPVTPLAEPLPAEPSPVVLPDDAVLLDVRGRPCRGDLYVIDAVHEHPAPIDDMAPVLARLQARVRRDFAAWFCTFDGPCEGAERVRAVGEQVLPADEVGPEDAARFNRLWFELDGERLAARDDAQCDIVSAIRTAVDAEGRLADANIARACDAVAQSPAHPTPEMLSWHLDRIALPAAPTPGTEVHLALIDTAVDPAVAEALDLELHPGSSDRPAIHGTAMAILARQAAPGARLHLFPALSADHTGPMGDVARALSRALSVMPAGLPRVINLSLGWPPETRAVAELTGAVLDGQRGRCATTEDPTGEPVRHMLIRASDGEAMVIAAAGNRGDSAWVGPQIVQDDDARDRCALGWRGDVLSQPPPLFFPAQWGLARTCRDDGDAVGRRLVLPIGAHDSRDRAAALHITNGYATLMAPGQHVVVDGPAPPRRVSVCVDGDTPPPPDPLPEVRLPATLSGTSVSAALTSGLAARWLGLLDAGTGLDPDEVTPRALELLLYATGRRLCPGRVHEGVDYRGISWPGMQALATCPDLESVLDCFVQEDDDLPMMVSTTLAACRDRFAACGVDPLPVEADCEAELPTVPDWADAECRPLRPDDDGAPDLSRTCDGPCPFRALAPDRYSVGGLGPQPQDPWCPDCRFTVQRPLFGGTGVVTLDIALNADAPAATDIVTPLLWVESQAGTQVYVSLTDYVPQGYWKPGAGFTIGGIKLSLPDDPMAWGKLDARLVLYVRQPDGKTIVRDVSPLRLIVR